MNQGCDSTIPEDFACLLSLNDGPYWGPQCRQVHNRWFTGSGKVRNMGAEEIATEMANAISQGSFSELYQMGSSLNYGPL